MDEAIKKAIESRPSPNFQVGQYHIDAASLKRKIHKIKELLEKGDILILGEDDMASVALSSLKQYNITIIDNDKRIIEAAKANCYTPLTAIEFNIQDLYQNKFPTLAKFDLFTTDPPYSVDGMILFIAIGIKFLKIGGYGLVVNYLNKDKQKTIDVSNAVYEFIKTNGCIIETQIPNFIYSPLSDKHCELIIIKKAQDQELNLKSIEGPEYFYHSRKLI